MKRLRMLVWLLPLVTVADWLGLKAGILFHPPWILALLVGAWVLVLLAQLAFLVRDLWLGRGKRWSVCTRLLLLTGVLVALGGGMANWALSFRGYLLIHEGEAVPIQADHFQELATGPFFSAGEMDGVILLEEVELIQEGAAFYPVSRLRFHRNGEAPVGIKVSAQQSGASGGLRFFQGAFGFAPRIMILHGEETIADRVVPFNTERGGVKGVSFRGSLTVEDEGLEVRGNIDLSSLDDQMRGHPKLVLSIVRQGRLLGRGSLLPGHFAELAEGYRVGFTDLSKWSEIDIKRRNYSHVVMVGGLLSLLGSVFWPVSRWLGL